MGCYASEGVWGDNRDAKFDLWAIVSDYGSHRTQRGGWEKDDVDDVEGGELGCRSLGVIVGSSSEDQRGKCLMEREEAEGRGAGKMMSLIWREIRSGLGSIHHPSLKLGSDVRNQRNVG